MRLKPVGFKDSYGNGYPAVLGYVARVIGDKCEWFIDHPDSGESVKVVPLYPPLIYRMTFKGRRYGLFRGVNGWLRLDKELNPTESCEDEVDTLLTKLMYYRRKCGVGVIKSPRSRYFVRIGGFLDNTGYVRVDTQNRVFLGSGEPCQYLTVDRCLELVEKGVWEEISLKQAKQLVNVK